MESRPSGHRFRVRGEGFDWNLTVNFFTQRVIHIWSNLPVKVVLVSLGSTGEMGRKPDCSMKVTTSLQFTQGGSLVQLVELLSYCPMDPGLILALCAVGVCAMITSVFSGCSTSNTCAGRVDAQCKLPTLL